MAKFIRYLGNAHLNFLNVAVYKSAGDKVSARVEHVVNGKSLGGRTFESIEAFDEWVDALPGSGAGRLANAIQAIAPHVVI